MSKAYFLLVAIPAMAVLATAPVLQAGSPVQLAQARFPGTEGSYLRGFLKGFGDPFENRRRREEHELRMRLLEAERREHELRMRLLEAELADRQRRARQPVRGSSCWEHPVSMADGSVISCLTCCLEDSGCWTTCEARP